MLGDIDNDIRYSFLSSFADDTRIFRKIKSIVDSFKLQCDLNSIYKWTSENNMKLNGCKFEHLTYGKNDVLRTQAIYLDDQGKKMKQKNVSRILES